MLEAALVAELLDRSVKPPRLNTPGSRVLEQARGLLQRTEALKALTSRDAEPHGLLLIVLAHPLEPRPKPARPCPFQTRHTRFVKT